jgi:hypothetical protein
MWRSEVEFTSPGGLALEGHDTCIDYPFGSTDRNLDGPPFKTRMLESQFVFTGLNALKSEPPVFTRYRQRKWFGRRMGADADNGTVQRRTRAIRHPTSY